MISCWKAKCTCCDTEKCRGDTGEKGGAGPPGPVGNPGPQGIVGPEGGMGIQGNPGSLGCIGNAGSPGNNGEVGEAGPVGNPGATGLPGPDGKNGVDGLDGYPGKTGATGSMGNNGSTGPAGTVGLNSIYLWGSNDQPLLETNRWQFVEFEQKSIGPSGNQWVLSSEPGYKAVTTFQCGVAGYYLFFFKLDIFAGNSSTSTDINPTECVCSACLVLNGVELQGSCSVVEAPEQTHVYSCSNQVLANVRTGDKLSLMFWSTDTTTQLGNAKILEGKLPNGALTNQCCASLAIMRVS
jgi:hypothetical protein